MNIICISARSNVLCIISRSGIDSILSRQSQRGCRLLADIDRGRSLIAVFRQHIVACGSTAQRQAGNGNFLITACVCICHRTSCGNSQVIASNQAAKYRLSAVQLDRSCAVVLAVHSGNAACNRNRLLIDGERLLCGAGIVALTGDNDLCSARIGIIAVYCGIIRAGYQNLRAVHNVQCRCLCLAVVGYSINCGNRIRRQRLGSNGQGAVLECNFVILCFNASRNDRIGSCILTSSIIAVSIGQITGQRICRLVTGDKTSILYAVVCRCFAVRNSRIFCGNGQRCLCDDCIRLCTGHGVLAIVGLEYKLVLIADIRNRVSIDQRKRTCNSLSIQDCGTAVELNDLAPLLAVSAGLCRYSRPGDVDIFNRYSDGLLGVFIQCSRYCIGYILLRALADNQLIADHCYAFAACRCDAYRNIGSCQFFAVLVKCLCNIDIFICRIGSRNDHSIRSTGQLGTILIHLDCGRNRQAALNSDFSCSLCIAVFSGYGKYNTSGVLNRSLSAVLNIDRAIVCDQNAFNLRCNAPCDLLTLVDVIAHIGFYVILIICRYRRRCTGSFPAIRRNGCRICISNGKSLGYRLLALNVDRLGGRYTARLCSNRKCLRIGDSVLRICGNSDLAACHAYAGDFRRNAPLNLADHCIAVLVSYRRGERGIYRFGNRNVQRIHTTGNGNSLCLCRFAGNGQFCIGTARRGIALAGSRYGVRTSRRVVRNGDNTGILIDGNAIAAGNSPCDILRQVCTLCGGRSCLDGGTVGAVDFYRGLVQCNFADRRGYAVDGEHHSRCLYNRQCRVIQCSCLDNFNINRRFTAFYIARCRKSQTTNAIIC